MQWIQANSVYFLSGLVLAVTAVAVLLFFAVRRMLRRKPDSRMTYSPEESEAFEKHLEANFGPCKSVFHEISSPDGMHIDLRIIEPTEKFPCRRLFTCGMGARAMELPPAVRGKVPDRIELMLSLPSDWPMDEKSMQEIKFAWPMRLLRFLARFPWEESTWIGRGHTIPLEAFAENTRLNGVFFDCFESYPADAGRIVLSQETAVQILQVVPVYKEEIDYAEKHGSEELAKLLKEIACRPVDIARENYAPKE